jgi:hypothetical protein
MKKKKKDGGVTIGYAMGKADQMFSQLRRTMGAQENGTLETGLAVCVTCNKVMSIMALQNGHCVPRGVKETRFLIVNTGCQCATCNRFGNGQTIKFLKYIKEKYGEKIHAQLIEAGERKSTKKYKAYELMEMAREYQEKAIKIWEEAGLQYPWKKEKLN